MPRTRRILTRAGDQFENSGESWGFSNFENFEGTNRVTVDLIDDADDDGVRDFSFAMNMGGAEPVRKIVIWEHGFISLGEATQEQIAWVAQNGAFGNIFEFPGDVIAAGVQELDQVEWTFGAIDFEEPFTDPVPILRITWRNANFEQMQIQLTANDFAIVDSRVSNPGSDPGQVGFRIGGETLNGNSDFIPDYVEGATLRGVFEGTDSADFLRGSRRGDLLYGRDSDDTIDGRGGADEMRGGLGDDNYVVDNARDMILDPFNHGTDTVRTWVTLQLRNNLENLFLLGTEAINGTGNGSANRIVGNSAANRLDGAGGIDRMEGRLGNDVYMVETRGDYAVEAANAGIDRVESKITIGLHANVENLVLLDGALNGAGNGLANAITGNGAANRLDGRGGADQMRGRGGNDTYLVDNVLDKAIELAGEGLDRVVSSVTFTLGAEVERLSLGASDGIGGTGNGGANSIFGNSGANAINGKAGDDWLYGRLGDDVLTGEAGLDRFVFDSAPGAGNVDDIADFSTADDTIILSRSIFAGGAGRLSLDAFVNGTAAEDAQDRILYDAGTGDLFYDADGSGTGEAILFATVDPGTALTNADFVGL